MPSPALHPDARQILRQLTSKQAIDFCRRLLDRTINRVLTFSEFHDTARELVNEEPEDAALFLAALVAIDVGSPAAGEEPGQAPRPPPPCRT